MSSSQLASFWFTNLFYQCWKKCLLSILIIKYIIVQVSMETTFRRILVRLLQLLRKYFTIAFRNTENISLFLFRAFLDLWGPLRIISLASFCPFFILFERISKSLVKVFFHLSEVTYRGFLMQIPKTRKKFKEEI